MLGAFMNNWYGAAGITLTILLVLFTYVFASRNKYTSPIVSQSMLLYRFNGTKKYSRKMSSRTQSKRHYDKTNVKVIILDNQAYWIKDNIFYKAPLVGQSIDKEAAEEVDTISMDRVQLDKMLFIMDKLREGINDDSRGSGDK
jgi:hypothetical protein